MAGRKSGIFAGAAATWETPLFSVSAQAMFDATSDSNGRRFSIGLERTFFAGEHVMITPSVTAIQLDRNYANYYFGVLPGEARAGRETYSPGGTLNTSLGLQMDYLWGDHHALFLQPSTQHLATSSGTARSHRSQSRCCSWATCSVSELGR